MHSKRWTYMCVCLCVYVCLYIEIYIMHSRQKQQNRNIKTISKRRQTRSRILCTYVCMYICTYEYLYVLHRSDSRRPVGTDRRSKRPRDFDVTAQTIFQPCVSLYVSTQEHSDFPTEVTPMSKFTTPALYLYKFTYHINLHVKRVKFSYAND